MKYFITKIPVIRRDFEKTKSAKFKADIEIVSNDEGIIYAWNIIFSECWIDVESTPAWFNKKTSLFKKREELFKAIKLKQVKRPSRTHHALVSLNEDNLKQLNQYINKNYDSTIKNVVGLLKGSNPKGEAGDPTSAEIVVNDGTNSNFVILIDDLMPIRNKSFKPYAIGATVKPFMDYVNTNDDISMAYELMQEPKSIEEYRIYLSSIKAVVAKGRRDIQAIKTTLSNYRNVFSKNIDKYVKKFPFGFVDSSDFQKAHIEESHTVEGDIIDLSKNMNHKEACERHKKTLTDPNNFIPLTNEVHRKFDSYDITYNSEGAMVGLTEKGKEMMKRGSFAKYLVIDEWFMNKRRIEYFSLRNRRIGYTE